MSLLGADLLHAVERHALVRISRARLNVQNKKFASKIGFVLFALASRLGSSKDKAS